MAGTRAGGLKAAATNKIKYGESFYAGIGALGGAVSTPFAGFGSPHPGKDGLTGRERAQKAGQKGGRISRRPKKVA